MSEERELDVLEMYLEEPQQAAPCSPGEEASLLAGRMRMAVEEIKDIMKPTLDAMSVIED